MNIQATAPRFAAPRRAAEIPPLPPEQEPPPEQPHQPGENLVENILSSPELARQLAGRMGKGHGQTVIEVDGRQVIKIENTGPTLMERAIRGSQMMITAAAEEASKVVQADPAFAFKESALGVKTQVYNGLGKDVQTVADTAFLPMLRTVALLLDVKKLHDVLGNKDAPVIDKLVDGTHVLTDVVGLVGALGDKLVPGLAPFSPTMTAIGLAGDIAAYSYHVLAYLKERGQVNVVPPTA